VTSQDDVLHKERSATACVENDLKRALVATDCPLLRVRTLDFDRPSVPFNEQVSLVAAANRWFGSRLAGSSRMDRN